MMALLLGNATNIAVGVAATRVGIEGRRKANNYNRGDFGLKWYKISRTELSSSCWSTLVINYVVDLIVKSTNFLQILVVLGLCRELKINLYQGMNCTNRSSHPC